MKVGELNTVLLGKMVVYEMTEDGFGETELYRGLMIPKNLEDREVAFVKAYFIDEFQVYVKREG